MTLPLALLQLVSPALPVGGFGYSEGLEVLLQKGELNDIASLKSWLEAELQTGLLRVEAAALAPLQQAMICNDAPALFELNGWLLAQRDAVEMRAQQLQMGQSLLQLLAVMGWPLSMQKPELGWTAAWAWAGSCFEVPGDDLLEAYLYNWVANQISAAVRLVPFGASSGQCLQLQLAPLISAQSIFLWRKDPRSMFSAGVGAGLAQLQHGGLYSKLFRS